MESANKVPFCFSGYDKRDIPYATLGQAFQSLVRSLLSQSGQELSRWREALRAALGPHGHWLCGLWNRRGLEHTGPLLDTPQRLERHREVLA